MSAPPRHCVRCGRGKAECICNNSAMHEWAGDVPTPPVDLERTPLRVLDGFSDEPTRVERRAADRAAERIAVLDAQLQRSLELLGLLMREITGYTTPEVQAALFEARALRAEHGRGVALRNAEWVDRKS